MPTNCLNWSLFKNKISPRLTRMKVSPPSTLQDPCFHYCPEQSRQLFPDMLTDANEKMALATYTFWVLSFKVSHQNTHRENPLFCPCQLCKSRKQQEAENYTKITPFNQFAPMRIILIMLTQTRSQQIMYGMRLKGAAGGNSHLLLIHEKTDNKVSQCTHSIALCITQS